MRFSPGCNCCGGVPTPPVLGTVCFHLFSGCQRSGSRPALSVVTVQEGQAAPVNEIQHITFGGAISGGTFRLQYNFQTTGFINWSSNSATLAANTQAGLEGLASVGVGEATVTVASMTAGVGTLYVAFSGSQGGSDRVLMTVASNGLTGTGTLTLTTGTGRDGAANLRELQELIIDGTPSSGTFKLEFDGETTASITWSATAATLDANIAAALVALSNVGAPDVSVTAKIIRFQNGLGAQNVPELTIPENLLVGTRLISAAGASVSLYKDAVLVSSGVTDADGNIRMPIYNLYGSGFSLTATHPDHYPRTTTIGSLSANANAQTRTVLVYRLEVPFLWRLLDTDGVTPLPGMGIGMVGQVGSTTAGWSLSGTTDSNGEFRGMMPNADGGAGIPSTFAYTITPPTGSPTTGVYDLVLTPCGFLGASDGFYPLPISEWPA